MSPIEKKYTPQEKETPPLEGDELIELLKELGPSWSVINDHHLEKKFSFKDFKEALAFVIKIVAIADAENHHPDIHLSYGSVRIILWTHSIGGLSRNDFMLAAKFDEAASLK